MTHAGSDTVKLGLLSGILGVLILCPGCGSTVQPERIRAVAAYEVPLPTDQARNAFLEVLRDEAKAEGLHVDAATSEELAETAKILPDAAMTMHATVWRGMDDDQAEAVVMDFPDHLGEVWITFLRGEDPELARRFREQAMQRILRRWPATLSLPIMSNGVIPLRADLRRTARGYEVDPEEAWRYAPEPSDR